MVAARGMHTKTAESSANQQRETDAYFGEDSTCWRDVYAQENLKGLIYRQRTQTY
jgi:hypothetical protein